MITFDGGYERQAAATVKAAPAARRLADELSVDLGAVTATGPGGAITEGDVRGAAQPVDTERLSRSHREVPEVTVVEECDFTELNRVRGELSIVPFVLAATAAALQRFPEFNATLDGDDIVFLGRYHLGVAVQGSKGLVVPVVRDVDWGSIEELDAEVRRLGNAVRDDALQHDDLVGATFTVTSAGKARRLLCHAASQTPRRRSSASARSRHVQSSGMARS